MPIVDDLANPDSAQMINVDARRIEHRRLRVLAGEQRRFETVSNIQPLHRILRVTAPNATLRAATVRADKKFRIGFVGEDQKPHGRAATLSNTVVIESGSRLELRKAMPVRQSKLNHRIRVRADAKLDLLAIHGDRIAAAILVDAHFPEARACGLPLHLRQLQFLPVLADQFRLDPIGPIASESITAVRRDKEQ